MEHHPKPPSLAITVFGIWGFLISIIGAVVATIALLLLLVGDGAALRGGNLLLGGFLLALLGLGGFRLARAMEAGRGFYLASAAIITFSLLSIIALMPIGPEPTPAQAVVALVLLIFSAVAGGSLYEGREWFAMAHVATQRRASTPRRLTITLGTPVTPAPTKRSTRAGGKPRR